MGIAPEGREETRTGAGEEVSCSAGEESFTDSYLEYAKRKHGTAPVEEAWRQFEENLRRMGYPESEILSVFGGVTDDRTIETNDKVVQSSNYRGQRTRPGESIGTTGGSQGREGTRTADQTAGTLYGEYYLWKLSLDGSLKQQDVIDALNRTHLSKAQKRFLFEQRFLEAKQNPF